MVASRLVELIENNADTITRTVLARVRSDSRLRTYGRLSDSELLRRFGDDCSHLGHWLGVDDAALLEQRYAPLGRERFDEGVPLHEVVRAAQIFKRALVSFARRQSAEQTVYDLHSADELEHLVGGFFDETIFYLTKSYESALRECIDSARDDD